jgi:hypothetical protein
MEVPMSSSSPEPSDDIPDHAGLVPDEIHDPHVRWCGRRQGEPGAYPIRLAAVLAARQEIGSGDQAGRGVGDRSTRHFYLQAIALSRDDRAVLAAPGLAGLVATAELAEAGRRVILLDQEPEQSFGGQAFWSFGGLFLVNSPEQRRVRIKDSHELAWQDWLGTAEFDRELGGVGRRDPRP